MSETTLPDAPASNDMPRSSVNSAFRHVLPVGLALSPVGFLFGVLAAQTNWSAADVLLLSTLGFTGSGQFAFLVFSQQGIWTVGLLVIFMVILSMNLRYIPMSLSASQPLRVSTGYKFILAHCLADESYATERRDDNIKSRATIRISIFLFWALSTVAGCALSAFLPKSISNALTGLTFPVSAILFALSLMNILAYVKDEVASVGRWTMKSIVGPLVCLVIALALIGILGERYFWLPSILLCYFVLSQARRSRRP